MTDRVYAEVNLDALEQNYRTLRAKAGRALMASVKANAYGHGAVETARRLESAGADWLAVATADEALALRGAGLSLPVLVLGYTVPERAGELARRSVTLTVTGAEHAARLSAAAVEGGLTVRAHFKLDTGMARLGFSGAEELLAALTLPGLNAEGLYTHFAVSDVPGDPYTVQQTRRFTETLDILARAGHCFRYTHCANSGAVLYLEKDMPGNLARAGISIYGYTPDGRPSAELRPVMSLWSSVSALRDIKAGDSVSYGRRFVAKRDGRIAVLQCGYGDGYSRALSNKADVILRGRRCPIVGMVCMDMLMADVTHVPEARPGDWALMFGRDGGVSLPLEELAEKAGTIGYELLCAVGTRVPRVYKA